MDFFLPFLSFAQLCESHVTPSPPLRRGNQSPACERMSPTISSLMKAQTMHFSCQEATQYLTYVQTQEPHQLSRVSLENWDSSKPRVLT